MFQQSSRTQRRTSHSGLKPITGFACWLCLGLMLMSCVGCKFFARLRPDPFGPHSSCQFDPSMTPQSLIAQINANAALLQGWKSSSVTISMAGSPIELKGANIAVESPRNFRLLASKPLFSGPAADLGSNDREFWFWFDDERQPDVIMCRHEDVHEAGRVMPIPFEPDWLMEVLGVRQIDRGEEFTMEQQDGKYVQLYSHRITPEGRPVTKRMTVHCSGVVVEHALLDEEGGLIAQAKLSGHVQDQASGAILPTRIELNWPKTGMHLTLKIDKPHINPASNPAQFQIPANVRVRQIGRSRGVEQAGNRFD